jgi:hypothetical protein
MLVARNKPGRKPIPNRAEVRNEHVTIKMSPLELDLLHRLVSRWRSDRAARGHEGVFTVSMYIRELVTKDARRQGLLKKADKSV